MSIKEKLISLDEQGWKTSEITINITTKEQIQLCANNCKCVKSCDENLVIISVCNADIHIYGVELYLENFGAASIKISGNIHSITFEENGENQ